MCVFVCSCLLFTFDLFVNDYVFMVSLNVSEAVDALPKYKSVMANLIVSMAVMRSIVVSIIITIIIIIAYCNISIFNKNYHPL